MRIPLEATEEVQQAFREIWSALTPLLSGNIRLQGRRIIEAGKSKGQRDYITRTELDDLARKVEALEKKLK